MAQNSAPYWLTHTTNPYIMSSMNNSIDDDLTTITIDSTYADDHSWFSNYVGDQLIFDDIAVNPPADFQSVVERLERLEQRLEILVPNPELEAQWRQLAELRQQYQALEQECLTKQRIWDALKKQETP